MNITIGSRWKSAVDTTEVMVTKAPRTDTVLQSGGHDMLPATADRSADLAPLDGQAGGALLGKRYGDPETGLEVLCTKAGSGTLAAAGRPLEVQALKPLPSSD